LSLQDISLAPLSALTQKGVDNLDAADEQLRQSKRGRPLSLPPRSAWSTLADIQQRAQRKAAEQKRQSTEDRKKLWQLFRAGLDGDVLSDDVKAGQD